MSQTETQFQGGIVCLIDGFIQIHWLPGVAANPKLAFKRVFVIGSCCSLIFDDEGNIDENTRQAPGTDYGSLPVPGLVHLCRIV